MCTPTGLGGLFAQAKLEEITIDPIEIVTRFTSFDDYWEPLLSGQGSAPSYLVSRDQQTQTKFATG